MFLLYNGQLLLEAAWHLPLSNRAFQYNDGFFETIILEGQNVRFWTDHLNRIQEAAAVLRLQLPQAFTSEDFPFQMLGLAQKNACGNLARVKLKVWRAGEGLYTPQTDEVDWLMTAQPAQAPSEKPLQVFICESVRTVPSCFSSLKGINSPVYVMASREKTQKAADDLILLDPQGHLAELTFSNLFWIKEQTLCTPALKTGCLNGIMRRNLLRWAAHKNWQIQEGFFHPEALEQAEVVFAGNVTGLRLIESVDGKMVNSQPSILGQIRKEIGF